MSRIIAIGDLHGCYYTMVDLMNKINVDFTTDTVVFLGDYIDRGLYPVKTIHTIKALQQTHSNNVIALMGNHCDMCVRYYFDNDPCWTWNGYQNTYNQLEELPEWNKQELLKWMKNLPQRYQTKDFRFCHSGYWFDEKDKYGYYRVLWDRDWLKYGFIKNKRDDKPIIFGHTPHIESTFYDNDLCIDTGAVYYKHKGFGHLTACIIDDNNNISTVSVPTNEKDKVIE